MDIVSKVVVVESNKAALGVLRVFCQENNLIGMRASHSTIMDILGTNIDLGAIIISEDEETDGESGLELAYKIHQIRPELPIFLRRYDEETINDLPEKYQESVTGAFRFSNTEVLKEYIQKYLFSAYFPPDLVRDMREIAIDCLSNIFKNSRVSSGIPFLVKDKLFCGEVISLMALESSWCRGYMMLQANEESLLHYIRSGKTPVKGTDIDDIDTNTLLYEITNIIWGGIKNQLMSVEDTEDNDAFKIQVPIIFQPEKKYITFGSTNPSLCFNHLVSDPNDTDYIVEIHQRIVFNLNWSPEKYEESRREEEQWIERGELELF